MQLTPRQTDVVLFIRNTRHLRGYSPTYREIAAALGISRVTTVAHVKRLVAKGFLRHAARKARTFEVVSDIAPTEEIAA